jgi:hypothetical protein
VPSASTIARGVRRIRRAEPGAIATDRQLRIGRNGADFDALRSEMDEQRSLAARSIGREDVRVDLEPNVRPGRRARGKRDRDGASAEAFGGNIDRIARRRLNGGGLDGKGRRFLELNRAAGGRSSRDRIANRNNVGGVVVTDDRLLAASGPITIIEIGDAIDDRGLEVRRRVGWHRRFDPDAVR